MSMPNNIKIEKQLLSNIFRSNDILTETIGTLHASDFYHSTHSTIYAKMLELYKKNISIDALTLSNSMNKDVLISIGGTTALIDISESDFTTANHKSYIKIIKEHSDKRTVINACNEALRASESEKNIQEVISDLNNNLNGIRDADAVKTLSAQELMAKTMDNIEINYNNGGRITGITTGYVPIDRATNGFVKGDLMVIAARPSMGKTALILNMLARVPKESKAALFEMEMQPEKLGVRILAAKALIESQKLGRGQIDETDFEKLMIKCNEMSDKNNLVVNCRSSMTVGEIKAESKKIKIKQGLDVVCIDHIGKIKPDNLKASRNDQIGQITDGLKNMAKDLNVCTVILSQLSRGCESRVDKFPMLSDLRDSGNIEQDADEVLMLYRDDYYAEREQRESKKPGILEVMVAKNRDGQVGIMDLVYNTKYQIITEKIKGIELTADGENPF